jgi:hypothetical protein
MLPLVMDHLKQVVVWLFDIVDPMSCPTYQRQIIKSQFQIFNELTINVILTMFNNHSKKKLNHKQSLCQHEFEGHK